MENQAQTRWYDAAEAPPPAVQIKWKASGFRRDNGGRGTGGVLSWAQLPSSFTPDTSNTATGQTSDRQNKHHMSKHTHTHADGENTHSWTLTLTKHE
ncbi:hypothetical protein EYF80_048092 [Liparis tanakae]|uniref:Uncharacterized protein n=1 Tax=Liparis tanakae TaxID=230148 RepID=A0A4Z2FKP5_9TELE|nr:hypothetical protein EYF80_048092 [Liparis tanakae]